MQKYDIFLIYKYFLLFHCASWQFFIVAVGGFSLCQLAVFHYGSWQFFIMAVGSFLLWQLAVFYYASWQF